MRTVDLPYNEDSTLLFENIVDLPWAVFLDSCNNLTEQGRYDILTADPHITISSSGNETVVKEQGSYDVLLGNPLDILQTYLKLDNKKNNKEKYPFCGGVIGYFSYDLSRWTTCFFKKKLDSLNIPVMSLGIYDWAIVVDHKKLKTTLCFYEKYYKSKEEINEIIKLVKKIPRKNYRRKLFTASKTIKENMTTQVYKKTFNTVKKYIEQGDCYQVNLAKRFTVKISGDSWLAYKKSRKVNPAPFSAFMKHDNISIISASPERFLKVSGTNVETKPIKGTVSRASNTIDDNQKIQVLKKSKKDQAENLMIVDLLRNDLSKNCELHTVDVPKIFEIESFKTVHHMVSTVTGALKKKRNAVDLLKGCFPGGSITGAPKLRAMEIIDELEPDVRGIYCGSIGYIGFNGDMDLNIAIRTITLNEDICLFHAGGGIVYDSNCEAEHQELLDKASAMIKLLKMHAS
jgi:para-aminobenzoate synthetase component 1